MKWAWLQWFCFWISEPAAILLMAEILHQLVGSLSHYLQGFIHPRWCKISSINRIMYLGRCLFCGNQNPSNSDLTFQGWSMNVAELDDMYLGSTPRARGCNRAKWRFSYRDEQFPYPKNVSDVILVGGWVVTSQHPQPIPASLSTTNGGHPNPSKKWYIFTSAQGLRFNEKMTPHCLFPWDKTLEVFVWRSRVFFWRRWNVIALLFGSVWDLPWDLSPFWDSIFCWNIFGSVFPSVFFSTNRCFQK